MDLPVPVVGVRRPARGAGRCEGRGCRPALRGSPRAGEHARRNVSACARLRVGGLPKSGSWWRGTIHSSNGEREANGAKHTTGRVLEDQPRLIGDFVAHQSAEGALALADDVARRPAQLLADAVRDLRQVVEVEAQVIGLRARLAPQFWTTWR